MLRVSSWLAAAACFGLAPAAAAQSLDADADGDDEEYILAFEADRVEVDGDLRELELRGNVDVQVGRYRLTSQYLEVERTKRGVFVRGRGEVAACPCPESPVTVGFTWARLAPPTDYFVRNATLRVGGVPILWVPVLWLRSPDRVALLPPKVAWRGHDGLLLGSGVHVPLGSSKHTLDFTAAGYVEGGVELEARLLTPETTTRVTWDRLRTDLLAMEAVGFDAPVESAAVSWRIDAVRGPERGRRATIDLEEASRRYDRAAVAAYRTSPRANLALGVTADAARGGPLDELGTAGPRVHVGFAEAVGDVGSADFALDARSLRTRGQAELTTVAQRGELRFDARPGPLAASLELDERTSATVSEVLDGTTAAGRARVELSLPLVRQFGRISHWVQPFGEGTLGGVETRGAPLDAGSLLPGRFIAGLGGVRTRLGNHYARSAGSLALRAGVVETRQNVESVVAWRASTASRRIGLSAEGGWTPERDAVVSVARLRVGASDDIHLGVSAEGNSGGPLRLVRLVSDDGWHTPVSPWLDGDGWSTGASMGIPWTSWLATQAAVDWDLTEGQLLAVRGSIAYRHPCGCLAALAWAGHRIGRDGLDAWVALDLIP